MSQILKALFSLFVLVVVVAAGVGFWGFTQLQPVDSAKTEKTRFTVTKGQSISGIGQKLSEQGLIKNPLAFRFIVQANSLENKIQAGSFLLSPSMSVEEIAEQMTMGTEDLWITILEGWRAEEIADMLEEQELDDFDKEEFLALAKPDEGYLFPDTYLIPRAATAKTIHRLLCDTFEKKVEKGLATAIANSDHEFEETVIMASLVQREAREFDQMQIVAGVLWNRIEAGMGLNVDATLQYLKGYDQYEKTWWPQPLAKDKESTSQFNTYKYSGLPPHPISNPGLEALKAALEPVDTDYVYYLHDGRGNIYYAKTLDQHNANVQKYLR